MGGKTRFEKLLEPYHIGRVKTRNRMIKTAALMEFTLEQNKVFYEAVARGGVGIINVGSFDLVPFDVPYQLYVGDDKCLPGLTELAQVIHKYGCPTFLTVLHFGPRVKKGTPGVEALAASDYRPPNIRIISDAKNPYTMPRALTIAEIEEIVDNFARVAERAVKAGFDGIEISGATDHLINTFLSRAWNKRNDQYGPQSLENRSRIMVEIIKAIKKRLGQDFPVSVLINGAEYGIEKGITCEESQGFARILEKAGADSIQIRAFGYGEYSSILFCEQVFYPAPPRPLAKGLDGRYHGAGAVVPLAEAIKKVVSIPVTTVGRLSPELGEQILRYGKADLIGLTRRLMADPELPNKIASGRMDDIAVCTGCINCLDTILSYQGGSKCRINAALASEEDYIIKPAKKKKNVIVIGGGPAGMEAARVASLRGHKVTLYEKELRLGGLMPIAALVKGVEIEDIHALTQYLETQITKQGVKIILGKKVNNASVITETKPDVVVLALGGVSVIPKIRGIDNHLVVSNEELHRKLKIYLRFFRPKTLRWLTKIWMPVGKKVVIIGGSMHGCELAEFMIKRGRKVTIVETSDNLGEGLTAHHKFRLLKWIENKGSELMTSVKYEEITEKGLTVITNEGRKQTLETDTIVTALPLLPNTELINSLKDKAPEVYSIGDCREPGLIRNAIKDGWSISQNL